MIKPLRMGLIGLGRLGTLHADSIDLSTQAELVAIHDTSTEALGRAEDKYSAKTYHQLEDFLAEPMDAVIVSSSTSEHLLHIKALAEKGIAIFTEKPIGLTLESTDKVLKLIVEDKVPFQIGFQRRWDPRYIKAKKLIESGEIGDPVLFKSYGRDPNASHPSKWGLDKNGGLFLNAAIHDYDAARYLMGREVESISATGAALVHKDLKAVNDIDTCSSTLTLGADVIAITEWGRYATYGYDIGFEVVGTKGMIRVGLQEEPTFYIRHSNSESPSVYKVFAEAYRAEIDGFIDAIRRGTSPTPGIEDARRALNIALKARESSSQGGQTVTIPTLPSL